MQNIHYLPGDIVEYTEGEAFGAKTYTVDKADMTATNAVPLQGFVYGDRIWVSASSLRLVERNGRTVKSIIVNKEGRYRIEYTDGVTQVWGLQIKRWSLAALDRSNEELVSEYSRDGWLYEFGTPEPVTEDETPLADWEPDATETPVTFADINKGDKIRAVSKCGTERIGVVDQKRANGYAVDADGRGFLHDSDTLYCIAPPVSPEPDWYGYVGYVTTPTGDVWDVVRKRGWCSFAVTAQNDGTGRALYWPDVLSLGTFTAVKP